VSTHTSPRHSGPRHATAPGHPPTFPVTPARTGGASEDPTGTGQTAAALVAAGVACAVFGLAVVLAESSESVSQALTLSTAVGALSGKAVAAVVAYVVVWPALHLAWRDRPIEFHRVVRWTGALVVVGLLATFPPVFGLVAGH
jgi:hypothetical protein